MSVQFYSPFARVDNEMGGSKVQFATLGYSSAI